MRLLTFTNLYPDRDHPRHGIFVAERLRQLVATGELKAQVLALRPRHPFQRQWSCNLVSLGTENSIVVEYRTVPTLPFATNWIDPWLWARATCERMRTLSASERRDTIIDAHFLYPDGVAAVLLGRQLNLPVVITARGSDVNVKCANPIMRLWVRWAARNCAAMVTVSQALARRLENLCVRAPRVCVLRNGVDLAKFRFLGGDAFRSRLKISGKVVASVGHLTPDKGHHLAIEAVAGLPEVNLLIVGVGPELASLKRLAQRLGVSGRVHFLGLLPHEQMAELYSAADALVLASIREGMPNVILESLACGTRVVATDVGGVAEVVTSQEAGVMVTDRSAESLRDSLSGVLGEELDRDRVRAFAEQFSWSTVVDQQLALYRSVLHDAYSSTACEGIT